MLYISIFIPKFILYVYTTYKIFFCCIKI
jgi:hypothetical protein